MKNPGDTPVVEAALTYAQNGWYVFPLHGKKPYEFLAPNVKSHGYKDATTDEETIRAWWTYHKGATIGLATGSVSGVIVLDIDPPEGYYNLKQLQTTYSPLPETRRSRTGNKGLHFFFEYPGDGNTYKSAVGLAGLEGVDIRANGGYAVLPPSRLYGRLAYKWADPQIPIAPAPAWLLELITKGYAQTENAPQSLRFAHSPGGKWLQQALVRSREGNRNAVGFWLACQLRDDQVPEAEARSILLNYANLAPIGREQYTSKEAIASVRSAYSRPPRERARRIQL